MFHLVIILMAAGFVVAAIAVAIIPMWLGPLVQALLAAFSKGRVVRWIPAVLGALGLVTSIYYFCLYERIFPIWGVIIYWIIYGLLLWGVDAIVREIRRWILQKRAARQTANQTSRV